MNKQTKLEYIESGSEIERFERLLDILKENKNNKTIILIKQKSINTLYSKLLFQDYDLSLINSKYYVKYNKGELEKFKNGNSNILIIDRLLTSYENIRDLNMVIYYDLFINSVEKNINLHSNANSVIIFIQSDNVIGDFHSHQTKNIIDKDNLSISI